MDETYANHWFIPKEYFVSHEKLSHQENDGQEMIVP